MSDDIDYDYLSDQLANIDYDNQKLDRARNALVESSLVSLANIVITGLEMAEKIDRNTARMARSSVRLIDSMARLFLPLF